MLPKTGVYFLPDTKVVDFLQALNQYKRGCEKLGRVQEAKKAKIKFEELKSRERER